jgi:hypothetical protein
MDFMEYLGILSVLAGVPHSCVFFASLKPVIKVTLHM